MRGRAVARPAGCSRIEVEGEDARGLILKSGSGQVPVLYSSASQVLLRISKLPFRSILFIALSRAPPPFQNSSLKQNVQTNYTAHSVTGLTD